jgi:N-acetylglutamate synthase-like GNAT family acetyltransferase
MTEDAASGRLPGPAAVAADLEHAAGSSERDFYLAEFRGRTLALALPEAKPQDLEPLEGVLAELAENQTRLIVLAKDPALLSAAASTYVAAAGEAAWSAKLWRELQRHARVGVLVAPDEELASACRRIALRLRLAKVVWVDGLGPLRDPAGERISWMDAAGIEALLAGSGEGQRVAAEHLSPARRLLLEELGIMVRSGLPAVNLCAYDGVADDLFTFEGAGTFVARDRYLDVRRLALDEFDAAHDLVQRGVAEGFLVERSQEQLDHVLANAFGVFVEGRYLAGVGALLPADDNAGEICSLYTLTRFLREGIGAHLVSCALEFAGEAGLAYVFACTTSPRVQAFFERHGFDAVAPDRIPRSKWEGYPPERQPRVICLRRDLG